jgi:hypothetical protein
MARIVRRTAIEPTAFIIDGKEPGKLYWYDEDGGRHEATGEFPEIRSF